MARMACVDLPAFPLQILLRRHPEWRGFPAAVVEEDRPQGLLLWVNEAARRERVLPGMRYAAALSLAHELRAGTVSPAKITTETDALLQRLLFFSPEVEPARDEPGTFFLGAEGLGLLHPELADWAELIRADLRQAGYESRVAAGFTRFGCYAAARVISDSIVFADPADERATVRRIPIDRIACDAELRDTLARLGIFELGGFVDLPPAGIRRRFGKEAFGLHRRAHGDSWTPLAPEIPEDPHERRILLDHPETDRARLLYAIEADLQALLARLRARDRGLSVLAVELLFDRPGPDSSRVRLETLRPAAPVRDLKLLLDLLRLRLESIDFPSGVVEVRLEAGFVSLGPAQMELFSEASRRDLEAANRALARVRAEFGDGAVCVARLVDAHLPEAQRVLEPWVRLAAAEPRKMRTPPLVRRVYERPVPISLSRTRTAGGGNGDRTFDRGVTSDDGGPLGSIIRGSGIIAVGTIIETVGPFVVSGGWWKRAVERRYWYVRVAPEGAADLPSRETSMNSGSNPAYGDPPPDAVGAWLWIYHDARRRRWFRQGEVE